jgi:S1-C subfamily serine protease
MEQSEGRSRPERMTDHESTRTQRTRPERSRDHSTRTRTDREARSGSERVDVPRPEPRNPESSATDSGEKLTSVEIARLAEPCVFLIYSIDNNGYVNSQGTGFFIHEKGIGISNFHVLAGGVNWKVKTVDEEVYDIVDILDQSSVDDYIVFKTSAGSSVPFLKLAPGLPVKGEEVYVLGNPHGLESSLTKGIVSSIRSVNSTNDMIQIDAPIAPGSSGSPVINSRGRVIGVATSGFTDSDLNFALNINIIRFNPASY